jgi:hypothetical protein
VYACVRACFFERNSLGRVNGLVHTIRAVSCKEFGFPFVPIVVVHVKRSLR